MLGALLLLAGCGGTTTAEVDPDVNAVSESPSAEVTDDAFMASLAELAGTEWTGLDDTYNDRITFIFGADGSLSYRNSAGTFAEPGDTWTVVDDVLTFQASYGGPFGVGSHTGTYDASTGQLTVEYTTTTNRASTIVLSQVN